MESELLNLMREIIRDFNFHLSLDLSKYITDEEKRIVQKYIKNKHIIEQIKKEIFIFEPNIHTLKPIEQIQLVLTRILIHSFIELEKQGKIN